MPVALGPRGHLVPGHEDQCRWEGNFFLGRDRRHFGAGRDLTVNARVRPCDIFLDLTVGLADKPGQVFDRICKSPVMMLYYFFS